MAFSLPVILNPLLALLGLGAAIGALLGFVSSRFRIEEDPVVEQINDLLPQTQCGQCSYPGCRPYSEAIAAGDAINKCPPGGEKTIERLANLLNVKVLPLDETHGKEEPRKVAFIRESECIGCAKCIPACPVDAILGANKYMHTVISRECTGCDLCIEPCPVDCIDMIPVDDSSQVISPMSEEEYQACINCMLCVPECPVDILPHSLYRACKAGDLETARQLDLVTCIECGKCDDACPSHIPLTETYQQAMADLSVQWAEKARADLAKRRFELHEKRLARLAAEEEQRRLKRAELASEKRQGAPTNNIQAALERARARRKPK